MAMRRHACLWVGSQLQIWQKLTTEFQTPNHLLIQFLQVGPLPKVCTPAPLSELFCFPVVRVERACPCEAMRVLVGFQNMARNLPNFKQYNNVLSQFLQLRDPYPTYARQLHGQNCFDFQWRGLNPQFHAKPCAYARSNSGVQMYHAHLWSNHPGSRTHCHPHRRVSGPRHLINTPDAAWLHIRWLVRTRFLRLQLEHASVVLIGNLSERG